MPVFSISALIEPTTRACVDQLECESGREAVIRSMTAHQGRGYRAFVAVDLSWRPGDRGKIVYETSAVRGSTRTLG